MRATSRLQPCDRCGWIHDPSLVVAVGRFKPGGPDGYRTASGPGAPLRPSRCEAMQDVCDVLLARGH